MAHKIQQQWCEDIKNQFPTFFKNSKVLDIGSLDINGNNRHLFTNCHYVGVDVVKGKNVDVISIAHELTFPDESFDVVLSTNALEHDMYWDKTLKKMVKLLKPEGLMFFSVACSWNEHGTINTSPSQSGTSKMSKIWANYYRNLKKSDIENALNLPSIFKTFSLCTCHKDLQFHGIKLGKI
jgi:SAM-dependent methyltransferase